MLTGWQSFTPPGWDTNPSQFSSLSCSSRWYSFTSPGSGWKAKLLYMEKKVAQLFESRHSRDRTGELWSENRDIDLTTKPSKPAHIRDLSSVNYTCCEHALMLVVFKQFSYLNGKLLKMISKYSYNKWKKTAKSANFSKEFIILFRF